MTYNSLHKSSNLIQPDKHLVRLAGVLYLIIIVCGVWSEGFARSSLIDAQNPETTLEALRAAPGLLRLSLAADTVMAVADVGLAVLFWHLLRPLSPLLAATAAALRLVQAAIIGASLVILAGVPGMLAGANASLVPDLVQMHAIGYDIGLVFFGVGCVVMAVLLRRAGGVPAMIWVAVGLAGPVYVIGSALRLVAPNLLSAFQFAYVLPLVSETALCLWLLLSGKLFSVNRD